MIKLGFLASNNGSSMQAVVAAIAAGELAAEARLIVSNRQAAPALAFAQEHGIAAAFIPTLADPEAADARLVETMTAADVEWIVLSGYLRKLGPKVLAAYEGHILNIHPALLPRHGGQGMYGRRVHEAVVAAGETASGASVHLVDGEYDHGRVVARVEVTVLPGDTAADVERRVTATEPELFVKTLQGIVANFGALPER